MSIVAVLFCLTFSDHADPIVFYFVVLFSFVSFKTHLGCRYNVCIIGRDKHGGPLLALTSLFVVVLIRVTLDAFLCGYLEERIRLIANDASDAIVERLFCRTSVSRGLCSASVSRSADRSASSCGCSTCSNRCGPYWLRFK